MKLSKTQQEILDNAKRTIDVLRKYETFEDFYDNSYYEQFTFATGVNYNKAFRTSELAKQKYTIEEWEEKRKEFELCKKESILLIKGKKESIEKLEKLGFLKIIVKATWSGDCELVKILNY